MTKERKIYDVTFKIKAVELSNERSNITELARELGIRVSMLYKWCKDTISLVLVVFLAMELNILGYKISRITVAKYIIELGLKSKLSKKFRLPLILNTIIYLSKMY